MKSTIAILITALTFLGITRAAEKAADKPAHPYAGSHVTKQWQVPPSFIGELAAGSGKADARGVLESRGIQFGPGSSVGYDGKNLTFTNTPEQVALMDALVEQSFPNKEALWIQPKVEFRNATLREVVDFLVAKSKTLDPSGKGMNIVLKNMDGIGDGKITLSLTNVSLTEVLQYVAKINKLEVVKDSSSFIVARPIEEGKTPAPNSD